MLASNSKLAENGKTPAALKISKAEKKITWKAHPDKDIIGYRIYNNGKKIGSIKAGAKLSFSAEKGNFHVTAVDIAGKESAPSNIIKLGEEKPKEPEKEDKPDQTEQQSTEAENSN